MTRQNGTAAKGQAMMIEKIATVLAAWASRSAAALALGGAHHWEPVVQLGTIAPLKMRKQIDDGRWIYREPTEAETEEFLSSAAW
jgi:hypothetical protein